MISFKQYLAEVFDSPLQWKAGSVRGISGKYKRHNFTFANDGIIFDVEIDEDPGDNGTGYEISLYANGITNFTQQNQPFKIYATLIDIVDKFFKTHKLKSKDVVYMISADPVAGSIYKRFAKEFAKRHNGEARTFIKDSSWKVTIR